MLPLPIEWNSAFSTTTAKHRVELSGGHDNTFVVTVPGIHSGHEYGYRVTGRWDPGQGIWSNPNKLLVDPYARRLKGSVSGNEALRAGADEPSGSDSAGHNMRSVVSNGFFDWLESAKPNRGWNDTLLYETHVKSMTFTHPEIPPELRGTYLGIASEPIVNHLKSLGVTALELLPIHTSATEQIVSDRGQTNYWGYSTLGFFAPDPRFAATDDPVQRVEDDGSSVAPGRHRGHPRRGLQPHCRRQPPGAHPQLPRVRQPRLLPARPRRPAPVSRTGPGPATAVDLTRRGPRGWSWTASDIGSRRCASTGFVSISPPPWPGRPEHVRPRGADFFTGSSDDPVLRDVKLIAEPWDLGLALLPARQLSRRMVGMERALPRHHARILARAFPGTIDEFADSYRQLGTSSADEARLPRSTSSPPTTGSRWPTWCRTTRSTTRPTASTTTTGRPTTAPGTRELKATTDDAEIIELCEGAGPKHAC